LIVIGVNSPGDTLVFIYRAPGKLGQGGSSDGALLKPCTGT
jgi:hypothetical protein